jgi:hypothetical protein
LKEDPFDLSFDTLVQVKISAQNINGWSEESVPNTEDAGLEDTIQREPSAIVTMFEGLLTNTNQV